MGKVIEMKDEIDYTKKESYPPLECPVCGKVTAPWKLTKGLDVIHRCSNKDGHSDSNPVIVWKIKPDGEMIF